MEKGKIATGIFGTILLALLGGVLWQLLNPSELDTEQAALSKAYALSGELIEAGFSTMVRPHDPDSPSMGTTGHAYSVIKRGKLEDAKEGQRVVFLQNGQLTRHRVLANKGDHLITKGDANEHPDPPVYPDRYLGTLEGTFPFDPRK